MSFLSFRKSKLVKEKLEIIQVLTKIKNTFGYKIEVVFNEDVQAEGSLYEGVH